MAVLQRTILLLLCWQAAGKKPVDRSYQLNGVPAYTNGAQGIQFYASGAPGLIYPNIPVYIPGPVVNLGSQQSVDSYRPPYRPPPPPPQQQQPSASFTIEQSVDLTRGQHLPSVPSTYGPPKTVDMPLRRPHHRYHKHKYPLRRPVIYTHMHKGHLHTHYLPPSSPSAYKPPKPAYIPPSTETPETVYNHHAYSSSDQKPKYPVGPDVTQAVIGKPGIINNYDANLPVKIPSPKPNLLEVKDILKNADLHFVDVLENQPSTQRPQLFHQQELPNYQLYHQQNYPVAYHEDDKRQQQGFRPYPELYDQRYQIPQGYQNNHLEDSGSSDTVKIPVAVFKGVLPGMFATSLPVERSDETASSETLPAGFTPSKRTSDWIPVTGGVSQPRPETVRNLNKFGDDFFSDLSKKPESFIIEPSSQTPSNQNYPIAQHLVSEIGKPKTENKVVGDIISGRIPGGHNPFGVLPNKSPSSGTISNGSNLVVSSVIKFSR